MIYATLKYQRLIPDPMLAMNPKENATYFVGPTNSISLFLNRFMYF